MIDPETGYDTDSDRDVARELQRLEDDDQMYAAQLADMTRARGIAWVLEEVARIERRESEQVLALVRALKAELTR